MKTQKFKRIILCILTLAICCSFCCFVSSAESTIFRGPRTDVLFYGEYAANRSEASAWFSDPGYNEDDTDLGGSTYVHNLNMGTNGAAAEVYISVTFDDYSTGHISDYEDISTFYAGTTATANAAPLDDFDHCVIGFTTHHYIYEITYPLGVPGGVTSRLNPIVVIGTSS